ncbi:chalcone-flavanone isomerase-domain-containing protein [Umbelopsis sp. PMI_123]|nr:chalcone-flavanone isomerase-domain-containing protein [Umbelopsis sp. PMI_123]
MLRVRPISQSARRIWQPRLSVTHGLSVRFNGVGRYMTSTAIPKRTTGAQVWIPIVFSAVGASYLLSSTVQAEAARANLQEPRTQMEVPLTIHDAMDKKIVIGLGSRQVSFLKINVYVMAMYVRPKDVTMLERANLWTNTRTAMSDIDHAKKLLSYPIDISIRIVPTRPTGAAHLRDGFTRSLLQLLHEQSKDLSEDDERQILEAIQDFKSKFPKSKGEDLGTVKSKWLSDNFVIGYVKLDIVKNVKEEAFSYQ